MSENRLFLSGEENKYSSAVARGPMASIVKYLEHNFFSILLVTSASYLPVRTIRFISVIFGVTSNLAVMHTICGRVYCETALGQSRTVAVVCRLSRVAPNRPTRKADDR